MKGRNFWYYLLIFALAALPLTGCSGGGGSAGSVSSTEKGVSLTVQGKVDAGKTLAKTVGADTDPLSGTVKVLNAVDATVLGSATIGADGSFSGLAFTLPATKSIIVFRADTNKAVTPFYTIVPIDLSNPPAPGIGVSNAISILISQASTNTASVVSSGLGFSGALPSTTPAVTSGMLGDTGNSLPAGQSFTTAAQLVTQYGGQILAYNTSGLNLTGSLKDSLLPAQDASTLTGDELLNIVLDGKITGVSIPGNNPIVSFEVTNAATKKGIRGLKNFRLIIAQLKPAANGSPNEWASYMLTPSGTTPGRPLYETTGYTVLDNGDGSYTVKFAKDIKNVTNAGKGVTYDANLTHRVAVLVKTAPVAALTATGTSVTTFRNGKILFHDFVPATPSVAPTEQRIIVKKENCEACHSQLSITTPHGSNNGFNDSKFCVLCHTPQRGNGRDNVASIDGAYPALTETVAPDGRVTYSPGTYIADGVVIGDFPVYIHKIHMGEHLTKKNYNFANVLFNEVKLPQPVTNCRTCHVEDTVNAPQALNWKDKPSRKACGACHDNIDYATGLNLKPGGQAHIIQTDDSACASCHGATSPYYPDKVHKPVVPPDPNNTYLGGTSSNTNAAWLVGSQTNLPDGVVAISYDVGSVTAVPNATDPTKMNPSIKFKFKKNGTDVVFNTYAAGSVEEMITGFVGSPSVYFAWAVPQDGIAAPADYNVLAGTYIKNIWRGDGKDMKGNALSATAAGTMTGPDSSGYYTITLTGAFVASDATLLTGGVGFSYSLSSTPPLTQIDVAKYPYTPNSERLDPNKTDGSKVNAGVGGIGGISTGSTIVYKVADGYKGRRLIVETAKCNACHAQLGIGPTFHGGMRNNPQICSFCHTPNRASSSGWSVHVKYYIHGIHGAKKRTTPFTYYATTANPAGFSEVVFPGILNNCAVCHIAYDGTTSGPLAGTGTTYDFTAAPRVGTSNVPVYTSTLMSSLLWSSSARGAMPATPGPATSPYVTPGTDYGSVFSYNANTGVSTPATGTNLLHSPIATVCFACHDSNAAQAHMRANGGSINAVRSTITSFGVTNEQCLVCHGAGRVMNIKEVHRWK